MKNGISFALENIPLKNPCYPPYIYPEMMDKWMATTPNPLEIEIYANTCSPSLRWDLFWKYMCG